MDSPNFWQYSGGSSPLGAVRTPSGLDGALDLEKPRRRPIPRKGHTKSRTGCFSCKKRKIKCQEGVPECYHCLKAGLVCAYPVTEKALLVTAPQPSLPATSTTFTMKDMRFFHHYLMAAYPHLPVKADELWKNKIAQISHSHEYLMHAILGLAASHLNLFDKGRHDSSALSHRVAAINLLNHALSQPCRDQDENDARFATILALTFQSSYMEDGMLDFLSMIRGCTIVATTMKVPFEQSSFASFTTEGHVDTIRALMDRDQVVALDEEDRQGALDSLNKLRSIVQTPFEQKYLETVESTLLISRTSSIEAYATFGRLFTAHCTVSHEQFLTFMNPQNTVGQLLLAHFFAVKLLLHPILFIEMQHTQRNTDLATKMTVDWVEKIGAGIPQSHQDFIQWPLDYSNAWKESTTSDRTVMEELENRTRALY